MRFVHFYIFSALRISVVIFYNSLENTRYMQYIQRGKKLSLLLAFCCFFGFSYGHNQVLDIKLQPLQYSTPHLSKNKVLVIGLWQGYFASSIQRMGQKYLPLSRSLLQVSKQKELPSLPSIVVDDVIVMVHDRPNPFYIKGMSHHLERSPG